MKLFIDANVLVAVLNKEYPTFSYASRVLSLTDKSEFQLYTSSLALAIAFYFSAKKSGEKMAKRKIALLNTKIHLAPINQEAVNKAIKNKKVNNLEDGFQYYAAKESRCQKIITENLDDFYFSDIEVTNSANFLQSLINS